MLTKENNTIDLRKAIVADVASNKGLASQKAQVVLCMDISGSMDQMYRNGLVQEILERIVPIAKQFDDNGEFEMYLFESKCRKHPNNINEKNVSDLVNREILGKYSFGGTKYAPPIQMILEDFVPSSKNSGGLFGAFKKKESVKLKYPVYVIFITDGQNDDTSETAKVIREASNHGVFFQFVGIGSANFPFLEKLDDLDGRFIDNANFFPIKDMKKESDKDLYSKLLNEFPSWVNLARSKGMIE